MNALAAEKRMTPAEYLAAERASLEKHEFHDGQMFAMAGASKEHNLIVTNVLVALRGALGPRRCLVFPPDMRVKVPATGLYTYPDVSVVCHRPELEDEHGDTLLNPEVVFEVLSPSTEGYDRGTKFKSYRTIPSLRDYVLVSQAEILVEHAVRHEDGSWVLREHRAGERVELSSIGCAIAVDDLYIMVFDEAPARGV